MTLFNVFAQVRQQLETNPKEILDQEVKWDSNIPKDCFCCNEKIYNMPSVAPISGPKTVSCGTKAVFTTLKCEGASINWSVSPAISGTTGDTSPTFTIPDNAPAGNYTLSLTIRCGNKIVKNQVKFTITEVKNCTSDFNYQITKDASGTVTIETKPIMMAAGQEHWWGLQYNGTFPNCNSCASIPFANINSASVWGGYINPTGTLTPYMGTGITTGATPYGIKYNGFPANSCVRITHYVKCCGVLKRTTYCISISSGVAKMTSGSNTGEEKILDETVESTKK